MLIAAALCAAVVAVPVSAQAATTKLTDHDLYCTFMPWLKLCAPAKPAAAVVKATPKVAKVAAVAAPKPATKSTGLKVYACEKRTDGKPYLLSCSWK
jgi:hypothetical protein